MYCDAARGENKETHQLGEIMIMVMIMIMMMIIIMTLLVVLSWRGSN